MVKTPSELIQRSEQAYTGWLDGKSVYKAHFGIKELKGEIFDNRSYIIERDDGIVVGVWVSYRQIKGQWYVADIIGAPNDDAIRAMLNMTNPRVKPSRD